MPAYAVERDQFAGLDAQVVGISVDSVFSHIAWQKKDIGLLNYPLCSDFYPHAEVIQKYGLLREGPPLPGISERTIVIVDKSGKVAWLQQSRLDQVPDIDEIFEALRKINSGAQTAA
jgi:alkyl hydroperoxide reductase subunit AhpC